MIWTPQLIMALITLGMRAVSSFVDRRNAGQGASDGDLIAAAIANSDETERILLELIAGGVPLPTAADIQMAFAALPQMSSVSSDRLTVQATAQIEDRLGYFMAYPLSGNEDDKRGYAGDTALQAVRSLVKAKPELLEQA